MGQKSFSGIVISAGQLVGYWGQTDCSNLISSLLNAPIQSLTDQPLGISGSGLADDCWARLKDRDLILGREPFGITSLYWLELESTIWFSSHLRLLLPLIPQPEIDPAGFYGYSCFSFVPTPLSTVRAIRSIPAGTEVSWAWGDTAPVTISKFQWQQSVTQITDEQVAVSQLQGLLQSAVQRQIQDLTDRPVGVLLSGGLDSSIAAALLVQNGVKVRAYTLDFGEAGNSELPYAEQVASHLQIPLVRVPVTPKLVRQHLSSTIRALDSPYGDGVTVPLYLLNQAASQDVSVIFNGEGGDQLFGGWTNKPLMAASIYGESSDLIAPYLQTFHRLYGYEDRSFQPQLIPQLQLLNPADWIGDGLDQTYATELLHRLRRASLMLKGAQNIQPRATNLASWHGLKVRSIFCDLPLATWTFGVSGTLHLQGACEKYLLKRAVENLLPPEIIWRTKRGMGVPLNAWLYQELWSDLGSWLNPQVLQQAGYWQSDLANRIVSGKLGGSIQGRRIGEILWLMIMWEQWRIQVLGAKQTGQSWHHPFWIPPRLWRLVRTIKADL